MGTFTDPRDGKTYKTVTIGNQTWMAENLNYEAAGSKRFGEGGFINELPDNPLDPPIRKTISDAEIQANSNKYGRLYDWETAKRACPPGWHLPSEAEWQELVDFAGGEKIAGKKLKAISGWNSDNGQSGNGTDEYGFSALPGGGGAGLSPPVKFVAIGRQGYWWTSTEGSVYDAKSCTMWHNNTSANISNSERGNFSSVRCVKD